MSDEINYSLRPDLFEECTPGVWTTVSGMNSEANDWVRRRMREANKKVRAVRRLAAGSPTAVLRQLPVGQSFIFSQYKHTSQISAVVGRMAAVHGAKFKMGIDPLTACVVVTRTA